MSRRANPKFNSCFPKHWAIACRVAKFYASKYDVNGQKVPWEDIATYLWRTVLRFQKAEDVPLTFITKACKFAAMRYFVIQWKKKAKKAKRKLVFLGHEAFQILESESSFSQGTQKHQKFDIEDILRTLNPSEERLINEYYWEGKTLDQLAKSRGVTKQAVFQQLKTIYKKIRRQLDTQQK